MPTVITAKFPGGRYHATPWGHHVNEGQIEWPPCPWRLLRALIATGYAKLGWSEVPLVGRRLIETLAGVLPMYQLPQVSSAHSRHYMPIGELVKGIEKTTLVFDTWANVGADELAIRWDCELDNECKTLFRSLVEALGYLGRSESWVEACVAPSDFEFDETRAAVPHVRGDYRGPEWEQVPMMAPIRPDGYAKWRQERTNAALVELPLPEGKKKPGKALLKKREATVAPYPDDLIACLQKDTAWWKKQYSWSQPPGTQRVLYWRRRDTLVVSQPQICRRPTARPVTTMLLALTTASRNRSALPPVTRTLPQAELFHRAIVGRVGRGRKVYCPELTGQDADGWPLRCDHQHAHILPLDLDADGRLDHVLVHAPMGLGDAAQEAIRTLKRTWTKGGVGDLQLALVGRGELNSLHALPDSLQPRVQQLLGPVGGTTTWVSLTPFVAPRYVKRNGKNTLDGQINAELQSRGLPTATRVEVVTPDPQTSRLRHFRPRAGSRWKSTSQ